MKFISHLKPNNNALFPRLTEEEEEEAEEAGEEEEEDRAEDSKQFVNDDAAYEIKPNEHDDKKKHKFA